MTSEEPMVIVRDVKKQFKIPLDKTNGIKQFIVNFYKRKKGYRKFKALDGVSFEVNKGEFFGIVGRNGSGKSTLLKILSGIYNPDFGSAMVKGSLTPFIELGVGFNPELSGRENVYLNGALLGFSHKEMDAMYDEIVDFAELHDFMEERLKNYSSGMQVRLAFSIAIRADTDVLILDEVLAVGDAAFQQKCANYFKKIKSTGKTVILVTHSMTDVEKFCDRALLLKDGRVKSIGKPKKIAQQYATDNINVELAKTADDSINDPVKRLYIELNSTKPLSSHDELDILVSYELNIDIPVELSISIWKNNTTIIEHNTKGIKLESTPHEKHSLHYRYQLSQLNSDQYNVTVAIFNKDPFGLLRYSTEDYSFTIKNKNKLDGGILRQQGKWIRG